MLRKACSRIRLRHGGFGIKNRQPSLVWTPVRRTCCDKIVFKGSAVKKDNAVPDAAGDGIVDAHQKRPTQGPGAQQNDGNIMPLWFVNNSVLLTMLPFGGYAAYGALACGFMVSDMLMLRGALACGYFMLTSYHLFQRQPLKIPLFGSLIFAFVNSYFFVTIFIETVASLSDEEQSIYDAFFKAYMTQREFKVLLTHGAIKTAETRERIVLKGAQNKGLSIIVAGAAEVMIGSESTNDLVVVTLGTGSMIGEMSAFGAAKAATATVEALPGCRYLHWADFEVLRATLKKDTGPIRGLEVLIGRQLVQKVVQQNTYLFEKTKDAEKTETKSEDVPAKFPQYARRVSKAR